MSKNIMNKYIKICFLIIFIRSNFSFGGNAYYVPFDRWTYVSITPDTIISECVEKWVVAYNDDIKRLLSIIYVSGQANSFSSQSVRFLYVDGNSRIYIDAYGVASFNLKYGVKISIDELNAFRSILPVGAVMSCKKNT